MAQLKVTLDQMRTYMRGLDERLVDQTKYPDTWIDSKINTAFEIIATRRQPWLSEEVLDLSPYIEDGTKKFVVDMQYDVVGYKRIFTNLEGYMFIDGELYNSFNLAVQWKVLADQTVEITLDESKLKEGDNTMTFQYYYVPTVPDVETYMGADVYHMLRHGMESAAYESLRDLEKFALAESKIEKSAATVVNGLDIDIYAGDDWNGGFPR